MHDMKVTNNVMNLLQNIKGLFKPENKQVFETVVDDDQDVYESDRYVGVPASVIAPIDEWFNEPILTDNMQDYMIQETEIKQQSHEDGTEDIHQLMYEIATSSGKTTLQLDPTDSWNSGIGS